MGNAIDFPNTYPLDGDYPLVALSNPWGGGTPHMKAVGMLVVSLRGVIFGFWSHLGCSGQNAIIFSSEGLLSYLKTLSAGPAGV